MTTTIKKSIHAYASINSRYLSPKGLDLKGKIVHLKNNIKHRGTDNETERDEFFNEFKSFYDEYKDRFCDTLLFDLLQNGMNRLKGNSTSKQGERLMNFYMLLQSSSNKAAKLVTANFFGPALRTMKEKNKAANQSSAGPVIARSDDDAVKCLVEHIEKNIHQRKRLCCLFCINRRDKDS